MFHLLLLGGGRVFLSFFFVSKEGVGFFFFLGFSLSLSLSLTERIYVGCNTCTTSWSRFTGVFFCFVFFPIISLSLSLSLFPFLFVSAGGVLLPSFTEFFSFCFVLFSSSRVRHEKTKDEEEEEEEEEEEKLGRGLKRYVHPRRKGRKKKLFYFC